MKVFGLPVGDDGCGYYRCYSPLRQLQRMGHFVMLPTRGMVWLPEPETTEPGGIDIIVGQLMTGPRGMSFWEEWAGHAALVYDIDDDVFSSDHEGSLWYKMPECRDIAAYLLCASDLVTVSTDPLAEIVAKYNPNVTVLRNCVHERLLTLPRCPVCNSGHAPVGGTEGTVPAFACPGPRPGNVTIGWAGGTSHQRDFEYVAPMLSRFLRRNPAADFHFIGADYRALPAWKVPADRARHTTWKPDVWDYYAGIDFDIAIAPLDPAGKFNLAKSQIKALEMGALGIPVVASDCEAYRWYVEHGVTGFLVRRDHEWERYLRDLANDEAMRAEMGAAAKKLAAQWTIQEHGKDWEAAYSAIA